MKAKLFTGIMVTLFLMATLFVAIPVKAARTFTIGIIGPVGLPHWSPGQKEAAEMAAEEINAMGGLPFTGGNATIVLKFGNEYALPVPDPDSAAAEVTRLIAVEGCQLIIGGFRTEVTQAMIETAMDFGVPFIINGAATDELIEQTVAVNYARYKYLFRTNPGNITRIAYQLFGFIQFIIPLKLLPIYGQLFPGMAYPQVPVAVLTEDLAWTSELHIGLTDPTKYPAYLGQYANVTYAARIPETATDMSPYFTALQAATPQPRLIIHLFSGRVGLPFTIQWREFGLKALPLGINVLAQIQDHWTNTLGKCEYETTLNFFGTRTPVTPKALDFWDAFVTKTGKWPIYTAVGQYDTLMGLWDFVNATGISWADFTNPDTFVAAYENAPPRLGIAGKFKFTPKHDVYSPPEAIYPYKTEWVRALAVQWQAGKMEVACPIDADYSKKFKLLPWTYPSGFESLAETDTVAAAGSTTGIDGSIGDTDIGWVTGAWLTEPGVFGWNYNADLDGNEKINILDVSTVARDYGKSVSYPL